MGTSLTFQESRGPEDSGSVVAIGTHVEVELVPASGESEHLVFDIVRDSEADFTSGFLGAGTPLGRAILGHSAGSVVPYQVGDVTQVKILAVGASNRTPAGDVSADRQAVIRKAISQSDLADAVRFALTVDQKWGDTDPEGIASNWDRGPDEEPRST